MKLLIALGNPGKEYEKTRHNAGWLAIDKLAEDLNASWSDEKKRHAKIAKAMIGSETVVLAKPMTFMNLSGQALQSLRSFYKEVKPEDLLIVHDELDLEPGAMKFSERSGSGGHNGIKSIFETLGSKNTEPPILPRLRIGIGRPPQAGAPVDGWVLGQISDESIKIAQGKAVEALKAWITDGLPRAMNTWNS